ncbi:MAG: tryptophan-rich sensory protein [Oscillospiraceae bacterium]|nr:tryptophan-rich sensory protein [Oscillospiraceae bacterium]
MFLHPKASFKNPRFLICLLLPLAVGGLSSLLTYKSMEMYGQLRQPLLAPPGWVFPVAWTILYLLMGFGCWLILDRPPKERRVALTLYAVQLLLNFCWPLLFFNEQQFLPAFLLLLALLLVVILMTAAFWRLRKLAGWLQIPYCLWLAFALYLNWSIFLLN